MGKGRIVICSECGRERRNSARGLCGACYQRKRCAILRFCSGCQRERRAVIGGLCGTCRGNEYKAKMGAPLREKRAVAERERRKRMGDEYRKNDRERNQRRREQRLNYNHAYYRRNADELRRYQSEYRKAHPEWVHEVKRRYLFRKKGLQSTLTRHEWEAIKAGFDHRCVYCNRQMARLTQEHIIPVTKGGHYTADNIVSACSSCNSRKHTKDAFAFLLDRA